MIPNDPVMLLSYINTKLRDEYSSLDELCAELELDRAQIERKMEQAGYIYRPETNRFC